MGDREALAIHWGFNFEENEKFWGYEGKMIIYQPLMLQCEKAYGGCRILEKIGLINWNLGIFLGIRVKW